MIENIVFNQEKVDMLAKKRFQLRLKRVFDVILSLGLIILLSPLMILVTILIYLFDGGEPVFKQERITTHGKSFEILKFRTMKNCPLEIAIRDEYYISSLGKVLRKFKIDEILQLFNILKGEMSFVGTRPEIPFFVNQYTEEMFTTLLMPSGLTSIASIKFSDESKYFDGEDDVNKIYVDKVLPLKMKHNLEYIDNFSIFYDFKILVMTAFSILN